MLNIILNGKPYQAAEGTVQDLLLTLKHDPKRLAIEINHDLVPRTQHAQRSLREGDQVEIVTLVGGGSDSVTTAAIDEPLRVAGFSFASRLITGSGKYSSHNVMRD